MLVTLSPIYTCGLPHSTAHLKTFTGSASRRRGLKRYKASTIHFHQFFHLDYPSIPISIHPLSFIPLSAQRKNQLQVLTHSCHHIDMLDLGALRCPLSEGLQAFSTPECVPTCNTHAHKSLWYTDQLNLLASPAAYRHQLTFIYTFITHHSHFIHLLYHIHYQLFKWSFDVTGKQPKEPFPMSQNHVIWARMSCTEGWVLTATNAYSEIAADS